MVFRSSRPSKDGKRERQKSERRREQLSNKAAGFKGKSGGFSDGSSRYSLPRTRKRLDPVMERKNGPTRIVGEIAGADKTAPEMAKDAATVLATVGPEEIVDLGDWSGGPSGPQSDSQSGNRPRRRRRKPQADGRGSESSS